MREFFYVRVGLIVLFLIGLLFIVSCQPSVNNSNIVSVNLNANSLSNSSNSNTNLTTSPVNSNTVSVNIETKEPEKYQAKITLKFEATGNQPASFPPIIADFARNERESRMEFTLPNNEKVIYLNKTDNRYLVLPNRKEYALLDKESIGFEIRQMLMPSEIINRIKSAPGVEKVGEEKFNGREAIRYRYGAVTDTQTQAGKVNTESFFLVDKETGLPLHSEIVSTSETNNVQGYSGLKIITDMSDISTAISDDQFALPADYQKIDSEQVKAQVNLIFNTAAIFLNQLMKSTPNNSNSNSSAPSANK